MFTELECDQVRGRVVTTAGSEAQINPTIEAANAKLRVLSEAGYRFLANIFPESFAFVSQQEQCEELRIGREDIGDLRQIDGVIYTTLAGQKDREFIEIAGLAAIFEGPKVENN